MNHIIGGQYIGGEESTSEEGRHIQDCVGREVKVVQSCKSNYNRAKGVAVWQPTPRTAE